MKIKKLFLRKKNRRKGITLTELMVTIGIGGILAGVALVSIINIKSRAQSSKMVGEISSAFTAMQSCWTFSGAQVVIGPGGCDVVPGGMGGNKICSQDSNFNFGKWPKVTGKVDDYCYDSSASITNCASAIPGHPTPCPAPAPPPSCLPDTGCIASCSNAPRGCLNRSTWFVSLTNSTSEDKICCNSTMQGCKHIDYSATCDSSTK